MLEDLGKYTDLRSSSKPCSTPLETRRSITPSLDPYGDGSLWSSDNRETREVMQALLALPVEEVERLFIAMGSTFLRIGHEWQPFDPVDSSTAALLDWVGVELPTYRELGIDYLLLYPKAKLEQVAIELCGDHARQWEGLTRKVIASHILQHPGADLDRVPAELRIPRESKRAQERQATPDTEEDESA